MSDATAEVKELTWVPNLEASGKFKVDFSRNEAMPVNRYAQIQRRAEKAGAYLVSEAETIAALARGEFLWDDAGNFVGTKEMDPKDVLASRDYETERFGYFFRVESPGSYEWDIAASHRRMKAQQAMTTRIKRAVALLSDESSYSRGHSIDPQRIPGVIGEWEASTDARRDIQRSLAFGARVIREATLGAVVESDMRLVMAPEVATAISHTQEVVNYTDRFGVGSGRNRKYGLPDAMYDIDLCVEDAVGVCSRKGEMTRGYIMPSGVAALVARPGGVEAKEGPSLAFLSLLSYDDMSVVDATDDETGDLHSGVIDQFQAVVTSPISGFLFKGVLATDG